MIGDPKIGDLVTESSSVSGPPGLRSLDIAGLGTFDVDAPIEIGGRGTVEITPPPAPVVDEHAARVAAHQAETGWSPEMTVRLRLLASRVTRLQRQPSVGTGAHVLAMAIVVIDLLLAGFALGWTVAGDPDRGQYGVLILLAAFVPTVWAAWTLSRSFEHRRRPRYEAELSRLRAARSCGSPDCETCAAQS